MLTKVCEMRWVCSVAGACSLLAGLAGCVNYVEPSPPPRAQRAPQPPRPPEPMVVYQEPYPVPYQVPAPQTVIVRVDEEPAWVQPEVVACPWAPPPLLVEPIPPQPYPEAVWVGGYWVWHGNWVWARGRWSAPPRPEYHWVHPYYEHRDGIVLFIAGYWGHAEVAFAPPPAWRHYPVERPAPGVMPGPRPIGPNGVFIPAPPGSRPGLIVPAPIGVAPAAVMHAPPVVNVGMHIHADVDNRVSVVNQITNITNVTIVAPSGATANGAAFNATVPARGHAWPSATASTPVHGSPTTPPPPPAMPPPTAAAPSVVHQEEHARPVEQPMVIRIDGEHRHESPPPVRAAERRGDTDQAAQPVAVEPVHPKPRREDVPPAAKAEHPEHAVVPEMHREREAPAPHQEVAPHPKGTGNGPKEAQAETKTEAKTEGKGKDQAKEGDANHHQAHQGEQDVRHDR